MSAMGNRSGFSKGMVMVSTLPLSFLDEPMGGADPFSCLFLKLSDQLLPQNTTEG